MRIQVLEEALADLGQGFRFYESQEAGLGSYFLDELFADIDSLRNSAGIHPAYVLASPGPFQALSVCDLLQCEGGVCSRACRHGLSQESIVDQEAVEGGEVEDDSQLGEKLRDLEPFPEICEQAVLLW